MTSRKGYGDDIPLGQSCIMGSCGGGVHNMGAVVIWVILRARLKLCLPFNMGASCQLPQGFWHCQR